jgi:ferrous iron transport protein B
MGAIRKEMNNAKWSIGAIAYMTGFAYAMCLIVYQLGNLINGGAFGIGTIAAILTLGAFLFLLFRKNKNKN